VSVTSGLSDALARVSTALEGVQFALVFGSFGTLNFGPESDLDVAVSFPRALPPWTLSRWPAGWRRQPDGGVLPSGIVSTTSSINFRAGQVRANNVVVPITGNPLGVIVVEADISPGTTDFIFDVSGYFR